MPAKPKQPAKAPAKAAVKAPATAVAKKDPLLLTHAELVAKGPTRVEVVACDQTRTGYDILLLISNQLRQYAAPNMPCARQFMGDAVGKTFTIIAEGTGVEAQVTYVGETVTDVKPTTTAKDIVDKAMANMAPHVADAPLDPVVKDAQRYVGRQLSLMKITIKAAVALFNEMKELGIEMTPEMFQAVNSTLFINATKAGFADRLPPKISLKDLRAPEAKAEPVAPPVAPAPVESAEADGTPTDVPF